MVLLRCCSVSLLDTTWLRALPAPRASLPSPRFTCLPWYCLLINTAPQDEESLFMGLEYCPNGELYGQLSARGRLPLPDAVQYAAELVDTLAYLRCVLVRGGVWCAAGGGG